MVLPLLLQHNPTSRLITTELRSSGPINAEKMNVSTPKCDVSSSAATNSSNSTTTTTTKRRASAPARSLMSSSISGDRRCVSDGRRCIKTTTFDKVFVYEFSLTIGDNPAVREGCPVALGRTCVHKTVVDLESFEQSRSPGINKRRRAKDLYIPVCDRVALLMLRGFTPERIVETVMEVERIKKSRYECMKLNGWQKMNIAIDSAGRSLFRKFTSGNSNKNKNSTSLNSDSDSNDIKVGRDQKRGEAARTA